MRFEIKKLSGTEVQSLADDIGRLRIQVFREFPYLYDGDLEYERKYLSAYVKCERSLVAAAFVSGVLVGATTSLPMSESEEFNKNFLASGFDLNRIMYFGESIVLSEYRGYGLGKKFFEAREAHAQEVISNLEYTTFCAVDRSVEHPLRPSKYRSLDEFWRRLGYEKNESLKALYRWKDIDKEEEDEKHLTFWLKSWV